MTIPTLKTAVHRLEDAIITISGPALAISGILAGVDLVTGGNVFRISFLSLAWAICLLVTLDFQVLALGARAHRVYLSHKPTGRKVFEVVLAVAVAAAISYVSIQMQSIIARVNSAGVSIDLAAAQLGVNLIALIWERSALVLVLIFLSGWFREDDSTIIPAPPVQAPLDVDTLIDAIVERVSERVSVVEENQPLALAPARVGKVPSKEQEISAILAERPGATAEEIAQAAGCTVRTAAKWIERFTGDGEKGAARCGILKSLPAPNDSISS